jgi:hypothetical protein
MQETASDSKVIASFINRWEASGAAERANYQLFLCELCDVLGVPRPEPAKADPSQNSYEGWHEGWHEGWQPDGVRPSFKST